MDFSHRYLLFGLLLAAVPVLLHLLMRQKPKRLPFPAFRFLKQRFRTNQRKLNLQNLLLLLLRIGVVCALCLALAKPMLFARRTGLGSDRPVFAVLLFDVSPSMDYVAGVSRLDDAKGRAKELLDEMAAGSSVVVLDSGDVRQEPAVPVGEARKRVEALRIRPGAAALNRPVDQALQLLAQQDASPNAAPRVLYVFSDRTRASWDAVGVKPAVPAGVAVVYVDVGVSKPRDLGIEQVEVVPAVLSPGGSYDVRVRLRGTPGGHENVVTLDVDGDANPDREKDGGLAKEHTARLVVFENRKAPQPPANAPGDVPVQLTVRLKRQDNLTVNDVRHATFLVRRGRKLLTIVSDEAMKKDAPHPDSALVWDAALGAKRWAVEYRSVTEASNQAIGDFPVVCLFQTTTVPPTLWEKLTTFVKAGGGLAIVPAGEELTQVREFNDRAKAAGLLPAPLAKLTDATPLAYWEPFGASGRAHPLMEPFAKWAQGGADFGREDLRPFVRRFWTLDKLIPPAIDVARYADKERNVALAQVDVGKGRAILFTSPLEQRQLRPGKGVPRWDNYVDGGSSFALILIDQVCAFLAGATAAPELNFRAGVAPKLNVPSGVEGPFTLNGPGLSGADKAVRGTDLTFPQAIQQGQYRLTDARERIVAGFSVNVAPVETDLERVPVEQLENALGEGSVKHVGRSAELRDALADARRPPVDLLPYVMMGLLVVLALESLLANRFYRRAAVSETPPVQEVA